jgi:hypothetical protein
MFVNDEEVTECKCQSSSITLFTSVRYLVTGFKSSTLLISIGLELHLFEIISTHLLIANNLIPIQLGYPID